MFFFCFFLICQILLYLFYLFYLSFSIQSPLLKKKKSMKTSHHQAIAIVAIHLTLFPVASPWSSTSFMRSFKVHPRAAGTKEDRRSSPWENPQTRNFSCRFFFLGKAAGDEKSGHFNSWSHKMSSMQKEFSSLFWFKSLKHHGGVQCVLMSSLGNVASMNLGKNILGKNLSHLHKRKSPCS